MQFIDSQTTKLRKKVITEELRDKKDEFKNLLETCLKLHPDRLKDDDPRKWEYEEAFKKASTANAAGKWGDLFDVVDKYDIYLGPGEEANKCREVRYKKSRGRAQKKKSSYSWAYMKQKQIMTKLRL